MLGVSHGPLAALVGARLDLVRVDGYYHAAPAPQRVELARTIDTEILNVSGS